MLLTQALLLVHDIKVAVFYLMKKLSHLKALAFYLVWNVFVLTERQRM